MNSFDFSAEEQEISELRHLGLSDQEIARHLELTPAELSLVWQKLTHSLKDVTRDAAVDIVLAQLVLVARATLATKRNELALILKSSDDKAIVTFNVMGLITGVTLDSIKLLGIPPNKIVGLPIDAILTNRSRGVIQSGKEMERAGEGEKVFAVRSHSRADGSVFDAEHTVVAIVGDSGHITGFIREIRDLTSRRVHELEIEEIKSTIALLLHEHPAA